MGNYPQPCDMETTAFNVMRRQLASLLAINAPDDFINPPELGIMDRTIKRVKNGRYVLLPLSGRGHSSGYDPSLWKNHLEELLRSPLTRESSAGPGAGFEDSALKH
jgi:hypothetical protein